MKKDTLLGHLGRDPTQHHGAVNTPVFRASTIVFPDLETYSTRPADDYKTPRYGIHGTPEPSKVGKTESHGCIRLTNWSIAEMAEAVAPGTPAVLQE